MFPVTNSVTFVNFQSDHEGIFLFGYLCIDSLNWIHFLRLRFDYILKTLIHRYFLISKILSKLYLRYLLVNKFESFVGYFCWNLFLILILRFLSLLGVFQSILRFINNQFLDFQEVFQHDSTEFLVLNQNYNRLHLPKSQFIWLIQSYPNSILIFFNAMLY